MNRSITNPTIPRSDFNARTQVNFNGKRVKARHNTGGSPRDFEDFEEEEEEIQKSPGPGEYLQPYHFNKVGHSPIIHKHPQNFGTLIKRFNQASIGSPLGPG